ncbi:MAG: prepilin-type N-terminal cleavage/methylation domain-containing protein, partial [Planctomycetota bacterium]
MLANARSSAHPSIRRGMSLLELLAVATLMGIFASVATMRLGRDIFGDSGARSEARKISLGMMEAQRSAILTGQTHGIQFHGPLNRITAWSVVRVSPTGSRIKVDGPTDIPGELQVSVDSNEVLFDFEGNGNRRIQVDLVGPHRKWRIIVMPLTRMIDCSEVP